MNIQMSGDIEKVVKERHLDDRLLALWRELSKRHSNLKSMEIVRIFLFAEGISGDGRGHERRESFGAEMSVRDFDFDKRFGYVLSSAYIEPSKTEPTLYVSIHPSRYNQEQYFVRVHLAE